MSKFINVSLPDDTHNDAWVNFDMVTLFIPHSDGSVIYGPMFKDGKVVIFETPEQLMELLKTAK